MQRLENKLGAQNHSFILNKMNLVDKSQLHQQQLNEADKHSQSSLSHLGKFLSTRPESINRMVDSKRHQVGGGTGSRLTRKVTFTQKTAVGKKTALKNATNTLINNVDTDLHRDNANAKDQSEYSNLKDRKTSAERLRLVTSTKGKANDD